MAQGPQRDKGQRASVMAERKNYGWCFPQAVSKSIWGSAMLILERKLGFPHSLNDSLSGYHLLDITLCSRH